MLLGRRADKSDPDLKERWPAGFAGFVWRLMAAARSKPAAVAGALFVLDERSAEPVSIMRAEEAARQLWERLEELTEPAPREPGELCSTLSSYWNV